MREKLINNPKGSPKKNRVINFAHWPNRGGGSGDKYRPFSVPLSQGLKKDLLKSIKHLRLGKLEFRMENEIII